MSSPRWPIRMPGPLADERHARPHRGPRDLEPAEPRPGALLDEEVLEEDAAGRFLDDLALRAHAFSFRSTSTISTFVVCSFHGVARPWARGMEALRMRPRALAATLT